MGEEAKTLFKKVAAKMANKTGQKYSETITLRPSENNGHRTAGLQGQAVAPNIFYHLNSKSELRHEYIWLFLNGHFRGK